MIMIMTKKIFVFRSVCSDCKRRIWGEGLTHWIKQLDTSFVLPPGVGGGVEVDVGRWEGSEAVGILEGFKVGSVDTLICFSGESKRCR